MITDLPWELESEILSRVPATSLRLLRFTCKRWYALCKDPSFIKKNSQCEAAATLMVILKKDISVYSFSIDLNGIHNKYDQFIQITGKLESNFKDSEDLRISEIFHCERLLLCKTKDNRLVVWNPCTGQTKLIIQSRLSSSKCYTKHKYFLGYENNYNESCNSYKILRFSYYYRNDLNAPVVESEIYEFNSDSWRVLDVVTPKWFGLYKVGGVSLKGNTYWLDSDRDEDDVLAYFLLKFDFTTERYRRQPLPFESYDVDLVAVLSVVREEKLALLHQDDVNIYPLEMKIWMTNNTKTGEAKDFSWSKCLAVDFSQFKINCEPRVMSFLVDEENKRVMCSDEYEGVPKIYIVGEDMFKQVYRRCTKESKYDSPFLFSYVPRLVQIPARQSNPGN